MQLTFRPWRSPFLLFMLLMIGCDTFGVWVGMLLPSVQAAREAKRREHCVENLEQIGLAMQRYHQKYGHFPPSFIADERGKPNHSWRVLILPFLDKQKLYAEYRFDEPWNGPNNRALVRQMPAVYRCPSDCSPNPSHTSYAMLVGPRAISDGPTAHCLGDIKDGPSNTIMVAEAAEAGINWMEPRDLNTKKVDICVGGVEMDLRWEIFRSHGVAAIALFCDGSVRTLSKESVNPKELDAMISIDGGEPVRAEP